MNLNLPEQIALVLIVVAILLVMFRLLQGPTAADRIVAADTLGVITTAVMTLFAVWAVNPVYLDVALVYGTLSFVGVVALARSIERSGS